MNKPKPRSLSAEPLEERLPVSSSAAGVLFGWELLPKEPGVERSATPGYEVVKPVTPQTSLDLFTLNPLDLQLDALAVDLVHGEESLDTISSEADDPFVLTPLTPGDAISDVANDPHRELGDQLLLMAIANNETIFSSFDSPELRNDNFPSGVIDIVPGMSHEPIIVQSMATETTIDTEILPVPPTQDGGGPDVYLSDFCIDGQSVLPSPNPTVCLHARNHCNFRSCTGKTPCF